MPQLLTEIQKQKKYIIGSYPQKYNPHKIFKRYSCQKLWFNKLILTDIPLSDFFIQAKFLKYL